MSSELVPSLRARATAAVAALLLGESIAAAAVIGFGPPAGSAHPLLPTWAFGAVWIVLYPCLGVAAAEVWARRGHPLGRAALALVGCSLVVVALWMPIACASDDPWVAVVLDLQSWCVLWITAPVIHAVAPRSRGVWLPAAAWMPITTALSLAAAL